MSEEIIKCLNCEKPSCTNCLDTRNQREKDPDKRNRNKFFTLEDEKHTLKEWAVILNIKYNTLTRRVRNGILLEEMEEAKAYLEERKRYTA